MKLFKLLALAYGVSFGLIYLLAVVTEYAIGKENGMFVVIPLGLLIGMNARVRAEKFLGYTTYEAMKD